MFTSIMLDPPEVSTSRVSLELNDASTGIAVGSGGPDWGDAALEQFKADLKTGSLPVDSRMPNRIIVIPLIIGTTATTFATARTKLKQKVATLQRMGGWLRRGSGHYADIVDATLHFPDATGEAHLVEGEVTLTLEALPDFYGDEVTATAVTSSNPVISQLVTVAGENAARTRIKLSGIAADQHGMLWSARQTNYDAASTAQPFYQGESLTGLNTAASAVLSGASGGNAMGFNLAAGLGQAWTPVVSTDIVATGSMTHKGTYRVWARVYTTATSPTSVRLVWDIGEFSQPTRNDGVTLPAASQFYLVDLGEVNLVPSVVGSHRWVGSIQVFANNAAPTGNFYVDYVYLQNLDDYAGKVVGVQKDDSAIGLIKQSPNYTRPIGVTGATTNADDPASGTLAWTPPFAASPSANFWWVLTGSVGPGATVTTHYWKATNFGYVLPSALTITGLSFVPIFIVDSQDYGGTNSIVSVSGGIQCPSATVTALKAGVRQGSVTVNNPNINAGVQPAYGGAGQLFGTTWTGADLNSSTFGFEFQATLFNPTSLTISFTFVMVGNPAQAYATMAGGFPTYQDAVVYANKLSEIRSDGCFHQGPSNNWGEIAEVIGDLPRMPAAGLEGAPVELSCLLSRGGLGEATDEVSNRDSALDSKTVQVVYRPGYVFPS